MQMELVDLLLTCAFRDEKNLIIEIHSEYMLLRLTKRYMQARGMELPRDLIPLREKLEVKDNYKIWLVSRDEKNNNSTCSIFSIDQNRLFTNHQIGNVFEEGFAERGTIQANVIKQLETSASELPQSNEVANFQNCVLIVTVTKVETLAVKNAFSKAWKRVHIGEKTYYDLGLHGGISAILVQSEMGTATPAGALLTIRQAIQDLHPKTVIMCGIAYGLHPDKQKLGDILISKQIDYYEPQKIDIDQRQLPRGDRATASELPLDRFRSGVLDWKGASVHFGLMLSGEKLVNDPKFRSLLLYEEPEAIGGEMEGGGLYAACHNARVDWILVKGICDWADGNKNDDAQKIAARNAARFVLYVIEQHGWEDLKNSSLNPR